MRTWRESFGSSMPNIRSQPPKRTLTAWAFTGLHAFPCVRKNRISPPLLSVGPPKSQRRRFRLFNPFRKFRRQPIQPKQPPDGPTKREWEELIFEYEERANPHGLLPPSSKPILNPDQFRTLPYVEAAWMTSLTTVLWYFGRVLRMDAFLLLFYPMPTIYIASRWGLKVADEMFISTLFLVFVIVGPLFGVLYFFNTGLLTLAFSRALWYGFPWWGTLLLGSFAKAVGVVLQIYYVKGILHHNPFVAATEQITNLLTSMCKIFSGLGIGTMAAPSLNTVQIMLGGLIAFHSLYHVFCTQILSSLFLIKIGEHNELARKPNAMPLVRFLVRRSRRPRR